jgi:hypothetical protein
MSSSPFIECGLALSVRPDFNVLYLGFFAAIQALQHPAAPTNRDECIHHVDSAFYSMKRKRKKGEKLDNVFLSLQQAMIFGVLKVNGETISHHMKKESSCKTRQGLFTSVYPMRYRSIIASSRSLLDI